MVTKIIHGVIVGLASYWVITVFANIKSCRKVPGWFMISGAVLAAIAVMVW